MSTAELAAVEISCVICALQVTDCMLLPQHDWLMICVLQRCCDLRCVENPCQFKRLADSSPSLSVCLIPVGLGVTRVVVGRELSVREIAKVAANTDTEVEAFCHGALCVSYSGQCFSSGGCLVEGGTGRWGRQRMQVRCMMKVMLVCVTLQRTVLLIRWVPGGRCGLAVSLRCVGSACQLGYAEGE